MLDSIPHSGGEYNVSKEKAFEFSKISKNIHGDIENIVSGLKWSIGQKILLQLESFGIWIRKSTMF